MTSGNNGMENYINKRVKKTGQNDEQIIKNELEKTGTDGEAVSSTIKSLIPLSEYGEWFLGDVKRPVLTDKEKGIKRSLTLTPEIDDKLHVLNFIFKGWNQNEVMNCAINLLHEILIEGPKNMK